MANDIEIKVGVKGNDDIAKVARSLKGLENNVKVLSDTFKKGQLTSQALFKGLNQQISTLTRMGISYKDAKAAVFSYYNSLKQVEQGLDRVTKSQNNQISAARRASGVFNQFGEVSRLGGKNLNRFNLTLQQGGYQLQDFVVQMQSGTSFFTAFAQQGSQFASIFGPAGAVAGAVIAIGSVLAAMFYKFNHGAESIEDITKSVDTLTKVVGAYREAVDNTKQSGFDLSLQFGLATDSARELLQIQRSLAQVNATRSFSNTLSGVTSAFGSASNVEAVQQEISATRDLIKKREELADALSRASAAEAIGLNRQLSAVEDTIERYGDWEFQISSLREQFKISEQGAVDLILAATKVQSATTLDDQVSSAQSLANLLEQVTAGFVTGEDSAYELYQALLDAVASGLKLQQIDIASSIQAGASSAAQLAKELGVSLQIASRLMALGRGGEVVFDPRDPRYDRGAALRANQFGFEYGATSPFDPSRNKPSGGSGGGATPKTAAEYLDALLKEAEYKSRLVGLSEEEARVKEIVYEAQKQGITVSETQAQVIASVEAATRKQIEAEKQREAMMTSTQNNIKDAFMSMVEGSKSVLDAFKDMLRNILLEIYEQKVVTPMAEGIMGLLGFAKGGAFNNGVQMFANGGVVGSPTMFGHSGGLGVMGEAGPEAIMPLKRGSDGKLGVAGGGNVTVHQTFNFAANGDDSVKRIIAQAAPQIAQMTQKQIMDSRRRGGQMKATFS
jgi:hypothetical protein